MNAIIENLRVVCILTMPCTDYGAPSGCRRRIARSNRQFAGSHVRRRASAERQHSDVRHLVTAVVYYCRNYDQGVREGIGG
jgi:tRNA G26 N,N-dimethylase Trm1